MLFRSFGDHGGYILRPEGTAGIVRAYLQNGLKQLPAPLKVWLTGPMFRAENVQKVPLAVSVISPVQLATAGVRNFTDIGKISPSLVVRPAEQPQNSNISLRGVGTFAFGVGVE